MKFVAFIIYERLLCPSQVPKTGSFSISSFCSVFCVAASSEAALPYTSICRRGGIRSIPWSTAAVIAQFTDNPLNNSAKVPHRYYEFRNICICFVDGLPHSSHWAMKWYASQVGKEFRNASLQSFKRFSKKKWVAFRLLSEEVAHARNWGVSERSKYLIAN